MDCTITSINRPRHGYTLVEVMISSVFSLLVLGVAVTFCFYISQGASAINNHTLLETEGQLAVDNLTRDLRQARSVSAYSTDSMTFVDVDNNPLVLTFDSTSNTLSLIKTNNQLFQITGCASAQFQMYGGMVGAGTLDNTNVTSSVTNCRAVLVNWMLSSNAVYHASASESLQSAKIVFRNH